MRRYADTQASVTLEVCPGSVSEPMPSLRRSFALLAALLACDDSSLSPAADVSDFHLSIETNRPQYTLSADSFAYVTVTNASTAPVYFPMASYVVYERLVDGEWDDPFAWFIVDGIGPSFPLAPGAVHTDRSEERRVGKEGGGRRTGDKHMKYS